MVAIGYLRVSTDGQAESGAGMAAQRATIVTECQHRGLPLLEMAEDAGLSAKTLDRPALAGALARLEAGEAAVLVVAKLDRLARSVADFANLVRLAERQGWAVLACDLGVDMTTPTGGLLANVTASVAEWERKIIGTRTREALAARKAAGNSTPPSPIASEPSELPAPRSRPSPTDSTRRESLPPPLGPGHPPLSARSLCRRPSPRLRHDESPTLRQRSAAGVWPLPGLVLARGPSPHRTEHLHR
jgi:DNA invertase Pin-like site-specific DNA recombinase